MSDGVWVALIAASSAVIGPVILALVTHRLGRQDRELATRTLSEMKLRLRMEQNKVRALKRELRLRQPRTRRRR